MNWLHKPAPVAVLAFFLCKIKLWSVCLWFIESPPKNTGTNPRHYTLHCLKLPHFIHDLHILYIYIPYIPIYKANLYRKMFFLLYSTVSRDFWTKNRYKYFKIKQNSHVLYTVSCFLMHLHSTYLTIRSIFGRLKTHCTASFWARHT